MGQKELRSLSSIEKYEDMEYDIEYQGSAEDLMKVGININYKSKSSFQEFLKNLRRK